MSDAAPHAALCCPVFALRLPSPTDLAALDAYCRRALDDPDAEPTEAEQPAVARYETLLTGRALRLNCRSEASR